MGQLEVARCELPAESLLGGEGQGEAARRLWTALDRSCGNGVIVGVMQHVVRAALAHASAQRRLGRSLATYQGARSTIAEMMLALRLTRLVSLHAARAWDGSTHRNEGTEKLFALEKLREVCMRGVELMGADTLDGARTADLARASALLCSALGGVELLRSAVAQPALDGSWREGEGA
jgi:isovaleryl-CoA dehydrogenase